MISPDTVVTETMEREFPYIEIVPYGTKKETSENTNMTGNVHEQCIPFPHLLTVSMFNVNSLLSSKINQLPEA